MSKHLIIGTAAIFCCASTGVGTANAQTWLYTGTDYGTGSNWSTGVTPGAAQTATFNSAGSNQPVVGGNFTIGTVNMTAGSLMINSMRTLTVQSAFNLTNASILGNGALSLGTGSVLTVVGSSPVLIAATIAGTGTGAVAISGSDVTYTGANTYSGTTTIGAGRQLSLGNGGTTGTLGSGSVTNNGQLLFNRSNALVVTNVISGSGAVTQAGTGTTSLVGANTYTGPTTISVGTLSIGNNTPFGTLGSGAVIDNATLQINRTNALTIANDISGNGALVKLAGGTATLSGTNSYSGTTTISAGLLVVGAGGTTGTLGTGDVITAASSTLRFDRSDDITIANVISGGGAVSKRGANIVTLTGANIFTGTTTISSGTLQVGNGGLTGSLGSGNVNNTASLVFNRSNALTYGGVISGTGSLTQTGTGTTILTGANTYTGGTTISAGTLQIGNGGTTGSVTGNIVDNSALVFNRSSALTYGGVISGTGSIIQAGTGTTILTGANTYTGSTTISAGTLQAGATNVFAQNSAIASAATLDLNNFNQTIGSLAGSGTVTLGTATLTTGTDNSSTTFSGAISGGGGLTKIGAGTLNLRASNIYTGPTLIEAGTLSLTNNGSISASSRVVADGTFNISALLGAGTSIQSLAGSGVVTLGTKNLTITNANDTFAGIIGGTGALTIAGGTQTLSGTNNYAGPTTVAGGTLRAGAIGTFSPASAYTVAAPGTLNLNGFNQTLGSLSNAGTVSFGSAPGTTLTIAGNYVGNGGGVTMNTRLGGDDSPSDRLVVNGNTSGNSTLRITNVGGGGAQTSEGIKIVDVAGASNGTFALQGNYVFQGQQAVVGGPYAYTLQQNGINTPGDGDWYLRSSLVNPPPSAPAGPLYQPGVPLYENYAQVLLGMNELPTLQQRVGNRYWGGSDAMARSGVAPAIGATSPIPAASWGRIEGGHSDLQPNDMTGSTYSANQMKVQLGLDGLALENDSGRLIVGLTAQYGRTNADVASFFGNGRIQAEGAGVGATLTWYGENGFYIDGQAQTMFYRSDLVSALVGSMTQGNQGLGYAFSAESGKRIGMGNGWSLTPQAQLAYSQVDFDDFTDQFGARVSLRDANSLLGRAGLALNHQKIWNDGGGIGRSDIYGIANLHYEFLNGTNVDVAGIGFANAIDRLWGSIGVGGTYGWANGRYAIFGEVSYNASLNNSSHNRSYEGTGGFRATW
jgi:outer membrane autotransporter protein